MAIPKEKGGLSYEDWSAQSPSSSKEVEMSFRSFGQFIKQLRRNQGVSLRRFCEIYGLDPGNQSKMERDLKAPPISPEHRTQLAQRLGLSPDSEEWQTFFDLADIASGRVPRELLDDPVLASKLPLVFRSLRGEKLSADQLREVARYCNRVNPS